MAKRNDSDLAVHASTGNVFADLGLPHAREDMLKITQGYAWQHRATADDFSSLPEVPCVMQTDRERYLCSQGWGCSAYFGPVERR